MFFRVLVAAAVVAGIVVEFSRPVTAAGVQVQRADWSGRKLTVCVNDFDRAPGERIQIDFFVDGYLFDRMHVSNGFPAVCGDREFAPFGPRDGGRTISPFVVDEPGGVAVALPVKVLDEDCSVFEGTNAYVWCRSTMPRGRAEYYGIRQAITVPLISDAAWVGVDIGFGGLIQQVYSADRSYNLIDEHAAGGLGMALWGVAQPGFVPLPRCNWNPPPPAGDGPPWDVMHVIFPQGPNCNYGTWAEAVGLSVERGAVTGLMSYLLNPEHHGRRLTLQNFHVGQMVFNRGEYIELTYGYRNISPWNFGEIDQELPALHLNRTLNREFAWSTDQPPYYGYKAVAPGEVWGTRLVTPGISPFSGPGTEVWNGRWITVCGPGRVHCMTIAPALPPSRDGINMANLRANTDEINGPHGSTVSNHMSLVGRFAIPRADVIKTHTVYLFPYSVISPLPSGTTVLQRIYQLQRW